MPRSYSGLDKFVFVSYSHKDKETVYHIMDKLEGNGYRLWFDDGIDYGSEWADQIAKQISKCNLFLVFLSTNSLSKDSFVNKEIHFAVSEKKQILAIFIDEAHLESGLKLLIGEFQAHNFKGDPKEDKDFYENLFKVLPSDVCEDEKQPRCNKNQYSLIWKGEDYSYFLRQDQFFGQSYDVNTYYIVRLNHKSGEELNLFKFCFGPYGVSEETKCYSIYKTDKYPYLNNEIKEEEKLFFDIATQFDNSVVDERSPNMLIYGKVNKEGIFYSKFQFCIHYLFTDDVCVEELSKTGSLFTRIEGLPLIENYRKYNKEKN